MSVATIREKIARDEPALGMFFHYLTNPAIVEVLPEGLDFVVVNTEHNALDMGAFHGMQFALAGKGIACLVRIHNRDTEEVAKACDSFPDGVVIPYAEDVEETRRLVAAAKYRPLKGVALERLIQKGEWPGEKTRAYVEAKGANVFFAAMIESVRAVKDIDALCAIPGMDAVFVGPTDLTVSMGIPEERDAPEFVATCQRVIDAARKHGIAAGAHFVSLAQAQRIIRQGARFIPFSSDWYFIQRGLADSLAALSKF